MSYPEARYLGNEGKISATFRPADRKPELTIGSSTAVRYLASSTSTSVHFHKTMSESFFLLSGTMRLFNGERRIDATAGDFLYAPKGGVHAFHNESDEPASMLLLFALGAPREAFFEALAEKAAGRRFSDEEWNDICRSHDSYFV